MSRLPDITLRHLLIDSKRSIGIQFQPSAPIQALVNSFEDMRWSDEYNMAFIGNTNENFDRIFEIFKGIAWINCRYFTRNKPLQQGLEEVDLSSVRHRPVTGRLPTCPEEYIRLLEIKRYSLSTARSYTQLFSEFLGFFPEKTPMEITEKDIRKYLQVIVQQGKSSSLQNQVINAIKFYV
jgi:integrase/recombinase XerD